MKCILRLAVLLPPAVMNSCLQTTDTIIMEIAHAHTRTHTHKHSEGNGFFQSSCFNAPSPGLLCLTVLSQLVAGGFCPPCQAVLEDITHSLPRAAGCASRGTTAPSPLPRADAPKLSIPIWAETRLSSAAQVGEMTTYPSVSHSEGADRN